jgi:biotin carboxyl carrier protein
VAPVSARTGPGAPPADREKALSTASAGAAAGAHAPIASDSGAVRVSVGPASRLGEEPPIIVAPSSMLVGDGMPPDPAEAPAIQPDAPRAADQAETAGSRGRDPGTLPPIGWPLVDGEPVEAVLEPRDAERAILAVGRPDGPARHRVVLDRATTGRDGITRREVLVDGWRIQVEVEPERRAALRERARRGGAAASSLGPLEVRAVIPGRVVAINVEAGDAIETGQQMLVIEAMKMQNELRCSHAGTVSRVAVSPGDLIEVGDLLIVIE